MEEQNRQTDKLRNALHSQVGEMELHNLVESCKSHYVNLFRLKETAAKADVFYIMSGIWKTPTERLFLWIGGFRPSEILKVMECLLVSIFVVSIIKFAQALHESQ